MNVRQRSDGDLPACVRVLAAVHGHDGYPTRWPADAAGWLSPTGLQRAWVAEYGDAACGHIALVSGVDDAQLLEAAGRPRHELTAVTRFFVDPATRRRAIGASLLHAVTSYAAEHELGLVLDVVDTARSAAISLYERLGWQLVGYRTAGWVTADGVRPRLRLYVLP